MSIQLSRRGFLASAAVSALAVGMAGVKARSAFAAETAGLDAMAQAEHKTDVAFEFDEVDDY